MKHLYYLILFLFDIFTISHACIPECVWSCEVPNTVCQAVCNPVCKKPQCEYSCHGDMTCTLQPDCYIRCPEDQCASDSCPTCEVVCEPLNSFTKYRCFDCDPLCEAAECTWNCVKPTECGVPPVCDIICEQPSCECEVGECSNGLKNDVYYLIYLYIFCIVLFNFDL